MSLKASPESSTSTPSTSSPPSTSRPSPTPTRRRAVRTTSCCVPYVRETCKFLSSATASRQQICWLQPPADTRPGTGSDRLRARPVPASATYRERATTSVASTLRQKERSEPAGEKRRGLHIIERRGCPTTPQPRPAWPASVTHGRSQSTGTVGEGNGPSTRKWSRCRVDAWRLFLMRPGPPRAVRWAL
jgi:hypothetical protein